MKLDLGSSFRSEKVADNPKIQIPTKMSLELGKVPKLDLNLNKPIIPNRNTLNPASAGKSNVLKSVEMMKMKDTELNLKGLSDSDEELVVTSADKKPFSYNAPAQNEKRLLDGIAD